MSAVGGRRENKADLSTYSGYMQIHLNFMHVKQIIPNFDPMYPEIDISENI